MKNLDARTVIELVLLVLALVLLALRRAGVLYIPGGDGVHRPEE